jgi:iron only hydrogenase large subunit-like protein
MTVCPTQAIRVRNGKAIIIEERCVDCGNCCKACPVSAILIEQDDFEEIFKFPVRIALLPSVLIGQFPSRIKTEEIYRGLKSLGFTHIYEIDGVVDLVQQGYDTFIDTQREEKPAISTFCPAIVRLIQVRFPSLVDHLVRVKPPSDIAAIYYRKKMEAEGIDPGNIGIFYVTPCAAKIASIKSPIGEESSAVDGVINMEYLYNKLLHLIANNEFDKEGQALNQKISSKGILWSLTGGESKHQQGRCLAVDGMANVTEFLDRLEESEESNIDFLELRACDEGCAGGVLISGNRFLTVERLNRRAALHENESSALKLEAQFNETLYGLDKIHARSILALDPDRKKAIEKMNRVEELLKVLPGIDCAACGSPTCRSLAQDIVQERASLKMCIFLQELYIRDKRLSMEEADAINGQIWGKDRNYRSQRK